MVRGCPPYPYKDPVGILTVCYGHTGPDIIPGKYYSDAECEALLNQDLKPVFATIDRQVKVPLNEYRKTALATFIYNVGPTAFGKSTMLKSSIRATLGARAMKCAAGRLPAACSGKA